MQFICFVVIFGACSGLYQLQRYIYRRWWDRGLSAEIAFGASEAFEGGTVPFSERLTNAGRLPLPYVNVNYKLSQSLTQTDLNGAHTYYGFERNAAFTAPRRVSSVKRSQISCDRRGFYRISEAYMESADIFMGGGFKKRVPQNATLTVFPREIQVQGLEIPFLRISGEVLSKRYTQPDPFEFAGVREYQPFDSMRQINFSAWARTGAPMSNIHAHTASQEARIYLNFEKYTVFKRDGVYENAIRLAAFLTREYMEQGVPVAFYTNGVDCAAAEDNLPGLASAGMGATPRHLREVLELLARLDLDRSLFNESILPFLPDTAEGFSAVILISSYCGAGLRKWFARMRDAGASAMWIVPHAAIERDYMKGGEGMTLWEVSND